MCESVIQTGKEEAHCRVSALAARWVKWDLGKIKKGARNEINRNRKSQLGGTWNVARN